MDLRKRKTRAAIRAAFLELIAEKNVARITVTELSERAAINKSTFYLHYRDLLDLLEELEEELILQIVGAMGSVDCMFQDADRFFRRFAKNLLDRQALLLLLYHNGRTPSLQSKLVSAFRQQILEENPHVPFNEEMIIVLTFFLRGMMDVTLYEEFQDPQAVIEALTHTICTITDHYRSLLVAQHLLPKSKAPLKNSGVPF
ncbi:hypothetical protein ABB02_00050 [Clostridiaceae bacterium JG1575]|nr:hypothetical protein ABB02_00050 [Clostridiaceae bacterium JG1575]